MNPTHFFAPEIIKEIDIPQRGILSRTLYDDADVKVVLFGFSAGHELSAHTAPMPAALYFLRRGGPYARGGNPSRESRGVRAHATLSQPRHRGKDSARDASAHDERAQARKERLGGRLNK